MSSVTQNLATPTSDWTSGELISFNIHIEDVGAAAILNRNMEDLEGGPVPPLVPKEIWENASCPSWENGKDAEDGENAEDVRKFFRYLEFIENGKGRDGGGGGGGTPTGTWSSTTNRVLDLMSFLLGLMEFDQSRSQSSGYSQSHGGGRRQIQIQRRRDGGGEGGGGGLGGGTGGGGGSGGRAILRGVETTLPMPGGNVKAKLNLVVADKHQIYLIVYDCRSSFLSSNPEPRLIAQSIAAFAQTNVRRSNAGLPPYPGLYIPAIIMYASAPVFYRVPVTSGFVDAMRGGGYPGRMRVMRFVPPLGGGGGGGLGGREGGGGGGGGVGGNGGGRVERYKELGMVDLETRKVILRCLQAFRNVVIM
ncbi:hypothetical protein CC1G_14922 [Coprinopsis cinerea okayama7|uniref:Uncharacterized protein n=1 Tax=Coprinopsis cinerea (strain Okayama-7 / 130 / ATCC MYA-4618 / FGSC 9003) TaxID=240176 RepID=D6RNY7_COPC7|nr:hypothetical protein CC1G_14922 [Coprinopsis cinerea okayama7\|eukprot:XP_002910944.1 hypothetical protein CC1G_14922 [Coprinopsis cinerea okayama7\